MNAANVAWDAALIVLFGVLVARDLIERERGWMPFFTVAVLCFLVASLVMRVSGEWS